MFVEYKNKQNDKWESFSGEIGLERNYELFGILCEGVRKDSTSYPKKNSKKETDTPPESISRKGLPEDLGYWSKNNEEEQRGDYHHSTWLTIAEYEKALAIYCSILPTEEIIEYQALLSVLKFFEDSGKDVRLILWFDN